MTPASDDGLFERLLDAAAGDGAGAELYERRGALLELTEDEAGTTLLETRERGFALRLFKAGRSAFAASGPEHAPGLPAEARRRLPRARARRGVRLPAPAAGRGRRASPALRPHRRPTPTSPGRSSPPFGRRSRPRGAGRSRSARRRSRSGSGWNGSPRPRDATRHGGAVSRRSWRRSSAALRRDGSPPGSSEPRRALRSFPWRASRATPPTVSSCPLNGRPFEASRADVLLDPLVAAHLVGRLAPLFFGDEEEALLAARTRDGRDASRLARSFRSSTTPPRRAGSSEESGTAREPRRDGPASSSAGCRSVV